MDSESVERYFWGERVEMWAMPWKRSDNVVERVELSVSHDFWLKT